MKSTRKELKDYIEGKNEVLEELLMYRHIINEHVSDTVTVNQII